MKRYLTLITLMLFGVIASAQSVHNRASELVVKELTKDLPKTSIYEGLIRVDSAFSPWDEIEYFYQTIEIVKVADKSRGLMEEEQTLSDLVHRYERADQNERAMSKQVYQAAITRLESIYKEIRQLGVYADSLVRLLAEGAEKPSKFIGFKTLHRYKIIDKSGTEEHYTRYFLFDKELRRILINYDAETSNFEQAQELLTYLRKKP